jgi:hypothetical protein
MAVGQERDRPALTGGLEQAHVEILAQPVDQAAQVDQGEPASAQVGQHHDFEQVHRRVASLREAARLGPVRRDGGLHQLLALPPAQLVGRQPGERRDVARTVVLLQAH